MVLTVINEDRECQIPLAIHTQAIERSIQIMHTHLHEPLILADLASAAYLSPYYFNRIFSRHIGVPPGEFLAALRLQTARNLLLTTSLSVTDICFEVGYNSTGSFTTRFTQMVGLSPRLLRQRAHQFSGPSIENIQQPSTPFQHFKMKNTLKGRITVPATFQGVIYIGLFTRPIPQGAPIACTTLYSSGYYQLQDIPDGVYYLLSAAFPTAYDTQSYLVPGKNILLGSYGKPIMFRNDCISGNFDLTLHAPRLTDAPLVMGLPLL